MVLSPDEVVRDGGPNERPQLSPEQEGVFQELDQKIEAMLRGGDYEVQFRRDLGVDQVDTAVKGAIMWEYSQAGWDVKVESVVTGYDMRHEANYGSAFVFEPKPGR